SPLCHVTPLRTCSVHCVRSGDASQDSTSIGRTTLSDPTTVMYSRTGRVWFDISFQLYVAGSSILATACPTRNVPPFLALGSSGKGTEPSARAGLRPTVA